MRPGWLGVSYVKGLLGLCDFLSRTFCLELTHAVTARKFGGNLGACGFHDVLRLLLIQFSCTVAVGARQTSFDFQVRIPDV